MLKPNNNNDWVGKVIHWELCQMLKFDHTAKWHMRRPNNNNDLVGKSIHW